MNRRRGGKETSGGRPFGRHLLRALPVIVIITAITFALDRFHLIDSFNLAALDAFIASAAPHRSDTVVIVAITESDYRDTFDGQSPLERQQLTRLLDRILEAHPAVVGIDIATAERDDAKNLQPHFAHPAAPIVWVQDAYDAAAEGGAPEDARWELGPVLGSLPPDPAVPNGVSLFPRERDRFVRGYHRRVELKTATGTVTVTSLPWAILEAYCTGHESRKGCGSVLHVRARQAEPSGHEESLRFNFAGDRYAFVKVNAGSVAAAPRRLFENAIVLVGGTFNAAHDSYPTPMGQMPGVELTALAIESELQGGGITPLNELLMVGADIAAGVILVWLNWRRPPGSRFSAAINGAMILLLAFAGSYLAFRTFGAWMNFVGVGLGVWLHQLHERGKEADEMRRELAALREKHI